MHSGHNHSGGYLKAPPAAMSIPLKSESRLSTDSPDTAAKKKGRRAKAAEEEEDICRDGSAEGQPPKKRGKGKGKAASKETTGPKRVFICPHCQVGDFFRVYF
jgi:hypothetical protein